MKIIELLDGSTWDMDTVLDKMQDDDFYYGLRGVGSCTGEKGHRFSLPYLLNVWWHRLGLDQFPTKRLDTTNRRRRQH